MSENVLFNMLLNVRRFMKTILFIYAEDWVSFLWLAKSRFLWEFKDSGHKTFYYLLKKCHKKFHRNFKHFLADKHHAFKVTHGHCTM